MRKYKLKNYAGLVLTERASNGLKNAGILDIEKLQTFDRRGLLSIKNMGRKSVDEIELELAKKGLKLKPSSAAPSVFRCPHCQKIININDLLESKEA